MVGSDLRIRRFTPAAERLLNLIPGDVGRPIGNIRPRFDCPELESLIAESVDQVSATERDVRDNTGQWYSLRIRPYKNQENQIDGAVLALVDVEESRRNEEAAREAGTRADQAERRSTDALAGLHLAESVIETIREPLIVLEEDLTVRIANKTFRRRFGLQLGDGVGRPITDLVPGRWDGPELHQLLRQVSENDAVDDYHFTFGSDGTGGSYVVNARRLAGPDGAPPVILLSLREAGDGKG
jgi:two-component system CheB/CheR fusion protein